MNNLLDSRRSYSSHNISIHIASIQTLLIHFIYSWTSMKKSTQSKENYVSLFMIHFRSGYINISVAIRNKRSY